MKQQSFETVLASSFRSHERRMLRYMTDNREKYLGAARFISGVHDRDFVFSRIAFAILSANTPFDQSVRALNYVLEHKGTASRLDIQQFTCVPAKADYVNTLWDSCVADPLRLLRHGYAESWSEYRYRLQRAVKGLGIAKASFAVSLLYPLTADVACIDTWMQKVFLGNTAFKVLGKATYEMVEAKIRSYARRVGVGTFIAQWMIWDHARGGMRNEHAIFPGSHKTESGGNEI